MAPWLRRFDYAVVLPVGAGGVRVRLAAPAAPPAEVLETMADALGLLGPDVAFDDPARGQMRRVRMEQGVLHGFLLAGDLRAQDALLSWAGGGDAPASVAALLTGRIVGAVRSRAVCVCNGVSEAAILAGIVRGCDLAALKSTLGCGTGCGSCVPEIQALIGRAARAGAPA